MPATSSGMGGSGRSAQKWRSHLAARRARSCACATVSRDESSISVIGRPPTHSATTIPRDSATKYGTGMRYAGSGSFVARCTRSSTSNWTRAAPPFGPPVEGSIRHLTTSGVGRPGTCARKMRECLVTTIGPSTWIAARSWTASGMCSRSSRRMSARSGDECCGGGMCVHCGVQTVRRRGKTWLVLGPCKFASALRRPVAGRFMPLGSSTALSYRHRRHSAGTRRTSAASTAARCSRARPTDGRRRGGAGRQARSTRSPRARRR